MVKRVCEEKAAGHTGGAEGGKGAASGSRAWKIAALIGLAALTVAGGCSHPLPQPDSAAAKLYAKRCGGCHYVYAPGSLTAAMWSIQVKMMEARIQRRGLPALTDKERQIIMKYLTRNAEQD